LDIRPNMQTSAAVSKIAIAHPVSYIHETVDGPVHLLVRASCAGWDALHWGRRLAGAWTFRTMMEANDYVLCRFQDLYHRHRCGAACGPVAALASHKSEDFWGMISE
jgi:hypothetical protein